MSVLDSVTSADSLLDRFRHLHDAPLSSGRRSMWWLRKTFFTKPRSRTPSFALDVTPEEAVRLLGRAHFVPGWELSYNYRGEVLNLRRGEYADREPYSWWQVHVRGYPGENGGVELTAHYETDPTEHPEAHVKLVGLDVGRGMRELRTVLDERGVAYAERDPPPAGTETEARVA